MKKNLKKALAFVCMLAMVFSLMPMGLGASVYADTEAAQYYDRADDKIKSQTAEIVTNSTTGMGGGYFPEYYMVCS